LVALGFTKSAIEHRVASGRLHPIGRGVYAVGWPRLTPRRRWMAAVLACGEGAALSHRFAGALWEILPSRDRPKAGKPVDVSVPRRLHRRRPGHEPRGDAVAIRVRCRPALAPKDLTDRYGLPATTVARTLLDLASELSETQLERAVNEADKRDLISPPRLRVALNGYRGQPGVRALRKVLEPETFRLSDSDLEILFRGIAARVGLPPPVSKLFVNDFEVDFFWPNLGLVVETDGLRYHRTASSQARDRLRDQTHAASGLATLRFTHWQVKHEPGHVAGVLRQTAAHLSAHKRA
jgi:hypothetical protein